jgi:hypothetical protein
MWSKGYSEQSARLGQGFLANRAAILLSERRKISEEDRAFLERVNSFLDSIQTHKSQVRNGKNAEGVESIGAILFAYRIIPQEDPSAFRNGIAKIKQEIQDILDTGDVKPSKAKEAAKFFRDFRRMTLQSNSRNPGQEKLTIQ